MVKGIEEWRKIDGFVNYEVSNLGRVINIKRGKLLKNRKDKDGYFNVIIHRDGKPYNHRVHRLVAKAFIPNPDNKPCIDHINTIRVDNRVENLKWCSHGENNNNPLTKIHISESLQGEKCYWYGKSGKQHHRSKQVIQFSSDGALKGIWGSILEAQRNTTIQQSDISRCCMGKLNTAGGYKWQYQDNYLADWWDREYMS